MRDRQFALNKIYEESKEIPKIIEALTYIEDDRDRILKNLTQERERRESAEGVLEMVQDNTKMPHKHENKQDRLYCLSERAG